MSMPLSQVLGVRVSWLPSDYRHSSFSAFQINIAVVVNLHFSSLFFVSLDSRFMATVPVLANSFIPMQQLDKGGYFSCRR
jgi:hypothetical protein